MRGDALPAPACDPAHGAAPGGCITCGDEALLLTVVRIDSARELALCEAEDGRRETVEIALVAPVAVGDELLVHAGTAIARPEAEQSPQTAGQDALAEVTS